jgi:hypothetical protein
LIRIDNGNLSRSEAGCRIADFGADVAFARIEEKPLCFFPGVLIWQGCETIVGTLELRTGCVTVSFLTAENAKDAERMVFNYPGVLCELGVLCGEVLGLSR